MELPLVHPQGQELAHADGSRQVLEVLSTDPNALKNFPLVLKRTGDRVLSMDQAEDHFRIRVRRGHAEDDESYTTVTKRDGIYKYETEPLY